MSHKSAIIDDINDLFRAPKAFTYADDVYKVCSWGACKSYLRWPEGEEPAGWDDLDEDTEFFVGRSGDRFVTVRAEDDSITKLYAHSESSVEDVAESICWELDLVDPEWEELS